MLKQDFGGSTSHKSPASLVGDGNEDNGFCGGGAPSPGATTGPGFGSFPYSGAPSDCHKSEQETKE